jgi:hypothetical protein
MTAAGRGRIRSRMEICFEGVTATTVPRGRLGSLGGDISAADTMVSRKGTIGAEDWISIFANRSRRSFRQRCTIGLAIIFLHSRWEYTYKPRDVIRRL